MNQFTINRIIKNSSHYKRTTIGQYTYDVDPNTGAVIRCKTSDVDRIWIDGKGVDPVEWSVVLYLTKDEMAAFCASCSNQLEGDCKNEIDSGY